jgi:hypothetical protein
MEQVRFILRAILEIRLLFPAVLLISASGVQADVFVAKIDPANGNATGQHKAPAQALLLMI